MKVEYRTLVGNEVLEFAEAIHDRLGFLIPHPQLATIELAIVDGEVAGCGVTQLVFHGEPLIVQPKFRGTGIAEELASRMRKVIEGSHAKMYVVIAENQFAEKLCEANGMVARPGKIYVKQLVQ